MSNKNEIDLIELLIKVYLYLKKYIWVLIIAISIGVIFTVIKSKSRKATYISSMVLKTKSENDFMYTFTFREFQNRFQKNPGELIVKIISSANELRKNGNLKALSKRMELTEEQVKKISSITASYNNKKGEAISNLVTINAVSTNKDVYKYLSNGIINYINNNSYINEKNKSDSIFLKQVIAKIDIKINELDSLQTKFMRSGNVKDIFIYKQNSFFAENIMLSSLKEKLIKELSGTKQTQIIEGFYLPKPTKKSIKSALIINVAIFVFIALFIIFFLIINKKAKQYIKK
ncbi:MAG: hypothetical protein L3J35_02760 [Bacteroidales bacterium]|nr:hypothetical protein [Bacteroidales bacterium]